MEKDDDDLFRELKKLSPERWALLKNLETINLCTQKIILRDVPKERDRCLAVLSMLADELQLIVGGTNQPSEDDTSDQLVELAPAVVQEDEGQGSTEDCMRNGKEDAEGGSKEDDKGDDDERGRELDSVLFYRKQGIKTVERCDSFLLRDAAIERKTSCSIDRVTSPSNFIVFLPISCLDRAVRSIVELQGESCRLKKPKVGDYCYAPYGGSGTDDDDVSRYEWRVQRVRIVALQTNSSGIKFAKVLCLDLNQTCWVAEESLVEIDLDQMYVGKAALQCCLFGVAPVGDVWSQDVVLAFKQFCVGSNEYFIQFMGARVAGSDTVPVKLVRIFSGKPVDAGVELVSGFHTEVKESEPTLLYDSAEVRLSLPDDNCIDQPPDEPQKWQLYMPFLPNCVAETDGDKDMEVEYTLANGLMRKIRCPVYENIKVEHLSERFEVYIGNRDVLKREYAKMADMLERFLEKHSEPCKELPSTSVYWGPPVYAIFKNGAHLRRCIVKGKLCDDEGGMYNIKVIDHGYSWSIVQRSQLFEMDESLAKIPPLVDMYPLAGINPRAERRGNEGTQFYKLYTSFKQISAVVVQMRLDMKYSEVKSVVLLARNPGTEWRCLNADFAHMTGTAVGSSPSVMDVLQQIKRKMNAQCARTQ